MSTSSEVTINTILAGDVNATLANAVALNEASPGMTEITNLASGANTITVPTGATVKGVILQPPSDNEETITLKGVTGDTGIALSLTGPSFLCFETAPSTFVLTCGDAIVGFRLTWI